MTNNSLSEDIYAVGQLMADNLNTVGVSDADVDDGLTTLANKILNASPTKINTVLTLDTPLVVYTDKFTVTGTLETALGNSIANATIQLIWNDGSEHIATGTTDSNGVFSFTSTDPASVSSYSFQLFFAGNTNYNASNSSVVNVNTAKETSVLNITSPASGSTVSTDTVTVTGTLKDNDGTAMSGKSVTVSLNSGTGSSVSVGSDGSFSKSVSGLVAGSNSISASFEAITTHTGSSQSVTVNRATFDGIDIDLTDGSQILSYADEQATPGSQYATLTAQLMNDDQAASISGVDIQFYKDGVLWDTIASDSSGQASKTYSCAGVGDVEIYAKCGSLVTETYDVHDYQYYADSMSKIKTNFTPITNVSGRTIYISPFTFNSDVELEFKLKNIPNSWLIGFGSDGTTWKDKGLWFKLQNYNQNYLSIMYRDTGNSNRDVGITNNYDTSTVFTIKSENLNKIYWYLDTVTKAYRDTYTSMPLGLRIDIFDNQDYGIEYIKVKPL